MGDDKGKSEYGISGNAKNENLADRGSKNNGSLKKAGVVNENRVSEGVKFIQYSIEGLYT